MLDWLQSYWGAVVAIATVLGTLVGIALYLEKKIEQSAQLRALVAQWLIVPSWHDRYRAWLEGALKWLVVWLGDLTTWRGTLQGLGVCVAVSMAYAAFSFVASWMLGGPGTVGNTQLLPRLQWLPQLGWGAALLGLMLVVGLGLILGGWIDSACEARLARWFGSFSVSSGRRTTWFYRLGGAIVAPSLWLSAAFYADVSGLAAYALPFAVAGAITGALLGAVAGAIGFGLAVAGAVAIVVAGVGAGPGAVAVAVAGAGAGAFTGGGAGTGAIGPTAVGAIAVAAAVGVTAAGVWVTGKLTNTFAVALLLFFAFLPVVNALLDWVSWTISRWLGHDLLKLMHGKATRLGRSVPVALLTHVLADLFAAFILLFGLAALMAFVVQLFNDFVISAGGVAPLALGSFLNDAVREPWPNGIWALSMLATTLVPTALHTCALIITLFLWFLQPAKWRKDIERGLVMRGRTAKAKADLDWAAIRASWLVILTPLVAGTLVVALAWGLVRLVGLLEPVARLLLSAAHFGIARADDLARCLGWLSS